MVERISDLLKRNTGLNFESELQLIPIGAGGAQVFSVEDKYIVKYVHFAEHDIGTTKGYKKEFSFYKACANKPFAFLPDIIFQTISDDEMLIVMKKYTPIRYNEWNEDLQKRAMELCAIINSVQLTSLSEVLDEPEKNNGNDPNDPYPLSVSFDNWTKLHNKYPTHIHADLLKDMYGNYNILDSLSNELEIPQTLSHGDFHPENFLRNGDELIVCDWQGVCVGRGIGDVAFFISRGTDMGILMDRDKLIGHYHNALMKYANVNTDLSVLHKHIALSEFGISFRFWAQYLQEADLEKVLGIYIAMSDAYKFLME